MVCDDALQWLARPGAVPSGALILTSLPDAVEVREVAPTLEDWKVWFVEAARCIFRALPPGGVAVFYQTDVRIAGVGQISKSYLVLRAAAEFEDVALRWHKIAHFGAIDRPSPTSLRFSHLLCFWRRGPEPVNGSMIGGLDLGSTIGDLVTRGEKPWGLKNSARCMGINATVEVLRWAQRRLPEVDTVVDPFCGAGTSLALGNELGFHAIGVDISARRVRQATALDGASLLAGRGSSRGGVLGSAAPAQEDDLAG